MTFAFNQLFWIITTGFLLSTSSSLKAQSELEQIMSTVSNVQDEEAQINLLKGVVVALKGISNVPAPKIWQELNQKLSKSTNPELQGIAQKLNQFFGDAAALEQALTQVMDTKSNLEKRKATLKSLAAKKYLPLLPKLEELLNSKLQEEAIRSYSFFKARSIPKTLMKHYKKFDTKSRQAVIETLATRKDFAYEIINSLKVKKIKKSEIPAYTARNLESLFGARFTKVYGSTQKVADDKSALIASYKKKLNSAAFKNADASRGRTVYDKTCAACHKMYDAGGIIGPDLTGSNRADQDYILLNIIDPSFDIPEAYQMVTITKKDGQMLVGNIVSESTSTVELKMVGMKTTIAKSDIKSRKVSKVSLMPDGLLSNLKDREFFDLIKYLQTSTQVEAAK